MSEPSTVSFPKAILLMGPTASGKTDLAIKLAQQCHCEIISVDSALIYKGMDIGTAKPSVSEQTLAPHLLVDIIDPKESYSAGNFRDDALRLMHEIVARGNTPLLVGGTMLYYKALVEGLSPLPSADAKVRAAIEQQVKETSWQALHDDYIKLTPYLHNASM